MELDELIDELESARDQQLIEMVLSEDWNSVILHKDKFNQKIFDFFVDSQTSYDTLSYLIRFVPIYGTYRNIAKAIRNVGVTGRGDYDTMLFINTIRDNVDIQDQNGLALFMSLNPSPYYVMLLITNVPSYRTEQVFSIFMSLNPSGNVLELALQISKEFRELYEEKYGTR